IGLGGIMKTTDVIEFIIAGASAIQVGTANFIDPRITVKIINGIEEYLNKHKIDSIRELVGSLKV
ncbi:MAG: dihydroorotate dehydrogenase, partial [Bacteroidales bacterium]|nr:dihydroorotate dehydrogenase [Bacteroidales bacterium]